MNKGKKVLVGIGGFFLFIVILGAIGASQTATREAQQVVPAPQPAPAPAPGPVQAPAPAPAPPPAPVPPPPPPAAQAPKAKTYAIGDRVVLGELAFTVREVKTASQVGSRIFGEDAEGIFVIVTLTIENLGKETVRVTDDQAKVRDSQGRIYDSSSRASFHLEKRLYYNQLQPALPITVQTIFDLPKNIGKISLQISEERLFSSKTELIELGDISSFGRG